MNQSRSKALTELLLAKDFRVWVKTEENVPVDKRVLMLSPWTLLMFRVRGANDRLDFVAVDQTSNVGVGDLRGWKAVPGSVPTK